MTLVREDRFDLQAQGGDKFSVRDTAVRGAPVILDSLDANSAKHAVDLLNAGKPIRLAVEFPREQYDLWVGEWRHGDVSLPQGGIASFCGGGWAEHFPSAHFGVAQALAEAVAALERRHQGIDIRAKLVYLRS